MKQNVTLAINPQMQTDEKKDEF